MSQPRALQNIRVVDFSWVRAGPWATRWLGAFGAEIIKIEWPENERGRLPSSTTPQHLEVNLNTSGNFADTNVNKKSLSLNVRSPKGLEIVKRLIAVSDIVIENFSSRVLQKWGLGYEEQCKIKPDIVYVSMSGYGHTGRNHHYTTFGPVAQSVAGLTHLSGLPDQAAGRLGLVLYGRYRRHVRRDVRPDRSLPSQHDRQGPAHRSVADGGERSPQRSVAAGRHRERPRRRNRPGFPPGNRAHWPGTPLVNNYRGPTVAPHNAYRTHPGGYNDWCVIVCHTDEEWQQLVAGHGRPVLGNVRKIRHRRRTPATPGGTRRLTSKPGRQTLGKYELTDRCQAAGVRALPVQSAEDRVEHDPQLRHRRDVPCQWSTPLWARYKVQNAPFKLSETPAFNHLPSPLIGQHTQEIVEGLLGYSHDDLRAGFDDGTFWPHETAALRLPCRRCSDDRRPRPLQRPARPGTRR